jgi:hypothetical protein
MNKKNIIYKAGVLLIAAVMVLSVLPAVTADTKPILPEQYNDRMEFFVATDEPISESASKLRYDPAVDPAITQETATVHLDATPVGKIDFETGSFAPGDIIWEQSVALSTESWTAGNINSAYDYAIIDNFWGLTAPIGTIKLTGLSYSGDPSGHTFKFTFYDDDPTNQLTPPSNVVQTYTTGILPAVYVDTYYAGGTDPYDAYEWTYELPVSLNLAGGWIQFECSGDTVYMLNSITPVKDNFIWRVTDAGTAAETDDRAYKLLEGEAGIECPPGCDFQILEINGIDGVINSLPHIISVDIANIGDVPIDEVKILVDL